MTDTVDATDSAFTPSKVEVVKNDGIDNVSSFADANDSPRIFPRQEISGVSRGIQQLAGPDLYADSGAGQIVVQEDGLPQIVLGNQATFGEGLFIAKPGINAVTNTDASGWLYTSVQPVLRIAHVDTGTIPATGSASSTVTIPHGLSFTPIALGFRQFGTAYSVCPTFSISTSTGVVTDLTTVSVDSVNVYLTRTIPGGGIPETPVKYYLFQETAN